MAAALAVTDEVALPIRAVGDLAAAAEVSREEVAVITQCAALGELATFAPVLPSLHFLPHRMLDVRDEGRLRACVRVWMQEPVNSCFFLLACMLQLASLLVWFRRMGSFF